MTPADEALEELINDAHAVLLKSGATSQDALHLTRLVELRSEDRVREMEIERFGKAFG